jgi:acyl carrier protein
MFKAPIQEKSAQRINMQSDLGVRDAASTLAAIRGILAKHGRIAGDINTLKDDSDLYLAGLTSLATVNVMLALEKHFDIEFPDSMLGRQTFVSIESIAEAIASLAR